MKAVFFSLLLLLQTALTVVVAEHLETASAMTLTVGSASDSDVRLTVGSAQVDSAPIAASVVDTAANNGSSPNATVADDNEELDENDAPLFLANECGRVKGCLFKPHLCTPHINCSYALSYRSDAKRVYLEVLGTVKSPLNSFVAVGFSDDMFMGNDSVSECSSFNGDPFTGRLSYNLGKSNRKVPIAVTAQNEILITHFAKYADGVLYCRLSQLLNPQENAKPQENVQVHFVRPLSVHNHIFMSSGLTSGQSLTIHSLAQGSDEYPLYTFDKVGLTHYQHDTDFSNMSPLPADAVATRILRHESNGDENESAEKSLNSLSGAAAVNPSIARQISDEARVRLLDDETVVVHVAEGENLDALDEDEEVQRVARLIKTHGNHDVN